MEVSEVLRRFAYGCQSLGNMSKILPDGLVFFILTPFIGLRAVAHLWQEFVLEMRYRWENDIFIPR